MLDRMFKAFADETRLRILHLLARKEELCVCDIQTLLGLTQSKVSRHLTYLKTAGLVRDRREGLWSHYSLTPADGKAHRSLLSCLSGCFSEVPRLQQDAQRLAKFNGSAARC